MTPSAVVLRFKVDIVSRTERLFVIVETLKRNKFASTASELSKRFGVSQRSIYRDIALLRDQGVPIDGEPGVGYILRNGYTLPPLMFSVEEIEALLFGAKLVAAITDKDFARSSQSAIAKIKDVVPHNVISKSNTSRQILGCSLKANSNDHLMATFRNAIKQNKKVSICYSDQQKNYTSRIIWPIAIGYFERKQLIAAWCEKRSLFRCFRTDRVLNWKVAAERYPVSDKLLFRQWQEIEKLELDEDI